MNRRNLDTDTHMGDREMKTGVHASTSRGTPEVPAKLRTQDGGLEQSVSHGLRKGQPGPHRDVRLLDPRLCGTLHFCEPVHPGCYCNHRAPTQRPLHVRLNDHPGL